MIQQIKAIVENYLNARSLAKLMYGIWQEEGVLVGQDVVPMEQIHVPAWLQIQVYETELAEGHSHQFQPCIVPEIGDSVCLLRDDRAKNYMILDVMKQ